MRNPEREAKDLPKGNALRIGVLSDTHHDESAVRRLMERLLADGPLSALCFLGDCATDLLAIADCLPASDNTALHAVRGNNDILSALPDERIVCLGGKKLLLVHGHLQRVKMHRLGLLLHAEESGADVVLFGHTHRQECAYERGILLLNPGAACGAHPSCAAITLRGGAVIPAQYCL